jgi:ABC-2 type transport system permease protein
MTNYISQLFVKTWVMTDMEIRKIIHDPSELITRALQPILWLGIFGEAMSKIKAIPTKGFTYLQFITPGILTQSVTFVAIFYGLAIIWERDMGLLQKILVTPTPRLALVWGKMISAGIRGLSQAAVIFVFALILQIHLQITAFSIIVDNCIDSKDPRTFYGHRPGAYTAAVFCLKRNLPDRDNAGVASTCRKA